MREVGLMGVGEEVEREVGLMCMVKWKNVVSEEGLMSIKKKMAIYMGLDGRMGTWWNYTG